MGQDRVNRNVNFSSPEELNRYCHLHNGLVKVENQIDGLKQELALLKKQNANLTKQNNTMVNALNNVNRLLSSAQSTAQQQVNNVNSQIIQQHLQQ